VSVVNARVVWASGTGGTYVVTTDGGATWRVGVVPGADSLEFRDVHAEDARTAWLLAAGPGDRSRVYHTTDGGGTWSRPFVNADPAAFFDCFAFWDARSGIAFSDNVRGVFPILRTEDGTTWSYLSSPEAPNPAVPPALPGEGAFAASGTCVVTQGDSAAWIATGAGIRARVFRTRDRGQSWEVSDAPIVQGTSTRGLTSIAFRDPCHGVAVGGDLAVPDSFAENVVRTADGGASWVPGGRPPFPGALYGVVYVPGLDSTLVAVGPRGAAWSPDDGRTWHGLDSLGYWSAGFATPGVGWLVGPEGRITSVRWRGGERPAGSRTR
jgi:photosystem II stability/assembly factor-like uncharacterized protein